MEYNFKKIGKRIASERKKHGFETQNALIKKLQEKYFIHVGRNTISSIECGSVNHFDCDLLAALCSEFDCDMGYLLCEYDCKCHQNADVQKVTGLSDKAIDNIKFIKQQGERLGENDRDLEMLNLIFSDYRALHDFLSYLNLFVDNPYTCSGHYKVRDSEPVKYTNTCGEENYIDNSDGEFVKDTDNGIIVGKPSRAHEGMYDSMGLPINILETYAIEEIKKTLRYWQQKFRSIKAKRE